jgi:chromate reductase
MTNAIRILGIAGSLRKASFNRGLLVAASELLPEGMSLEVFDLAPLPLYNADVDASGPPASVLELKKKISDANALLLATPEYNYSVPGVLKNAIDWASRPPKDSPLNGKPVAIMGAAGVGGTIRAQMHLRQILLFNGCLVLNKPEVYIMRAWEKFEASGKLLDQTSRDQIRALLESLGVWLRRIGE